EVAKIVVTIPEGFTVKQIEERLGLKLPGENLEGFLFPDTYQFPPRVSGAEVVKKMRDNFDKKFTPYRNEVSGAGLTPFEIITMASLLEKEVKTKEDKELVSGILWKRLENKIPLQIDATITYITGQKTTKISKEETQIDSPYNTYKYLGLPKGPICNPGLESILAAIYPKDSDYWYYLSTPEGETTFSKTLEEHNYAKSKYLR
ncbi:MAG: endolytic transglycosylase MltG, partial [Candidatus Nealsonbacteria bacterium CG_4_9_14_3_um_filter_37_29]